MKYSEEDANKIISICENKKFLGNSLCYRCVDDLLRAIHEITPENYYDILSTAIGREKIRGSNDNS